jgi:hypothetical protein
LINQKDQNFICNLNQIIDFRFVIIQIVVALQEFFDFLVLIIRIFLVPTSEIPTPSFFIFHPAIFDIPLIEFFLLLILNILLLTVSFPTLAFKFQVAQVLSFLEFRSPLKCVFLPLFFQILVILALFFPLLISAILTLQKSFFLPLIFQILVILVLFFPPPISAVLVIQKFFSLLLSFQILFIPILFSLLPVF